VKPSDQDLIERSLTGEREAFGELVLRYQDRLYGTLAQMLGSVHDALDVAQDSFILAFKNLHAFRKESQFYSWLFRIAYNAAMTRHRRERRHRTASLDDLVHEAPEESCNHSDPAHSVDSQDDIESVQQALRELPEEFRMVLVLKEIEEMPYAEIAETVGCPVGTVRSRIHRGRLMLKERLSRSMKSQA
jgi:RNA polymerase sigma-70 factor (ECF subfamily)